MLAVKAAVLAVVSLVSFAALPRNCASESLLEVLTDTVRVIDDRLQQQLHVVIKVSSLQPHARTLKGVGVVEFAQDICEAPHDTSLSDLVAGARASLKAALGDPRLLDSSLAILARRTLLACIVLRWVAHKQEGINKQAEDDLADITRGLYGIHVNSVARRGLVEYLHISKSGGTTFSAAAKSSHCAMAPGIGQLEELGDLARWINGTAFEELTDGTDVMWSYYSTAGRRGDGVACQDRVSYLKGLGYNYVSNEFTMHGGGSGGSGGSRSGGGSGRGRGGDGGGGDDGGDGMREVHACPQVVNVVTLRDPDSRLISHLHFMLARIKKRLSKRANGAEGGDTADAAAEGGGDDRDGGRGNSRRAAADPFRVFCPGDVGTWERVAPTVFDNYMTRSFIGERAFHSPVGSIGLEHMEVARRVLLQFDLVLDLDAGEEAADLVLWQGLGWNVTLAEIHERTSASVYAKLNYTAGECADEGLQQTLLARQAADRHLYSFGRVLALLDRLHFALARKLGLQPRVEGRGTGGSCGLLSASSSRGSGSGEGGGGNGDRNGRDDGNSDVSENGDGEELRRARRNRRLRLLPRRRLLRQQQRREGLLR